MPGFASGHLTTDPNLEDTDMEFAICFKGFMDPKRARIRHGITGTLLIGTGIGLALARRDA